MAGKKIREIEDKSNGGKLEKIIDKYKNIDYLNSPLYSAYKNLYEKYNKSQNSVSFYSKDTLLFLLSDIKTNTDSQVFINIDKNNKIKYTVKKNGIKCSIDELPKDQKNIVADCCKEIKKQMERDRYDNVL